MLIDRLIRVTDTREYQEIGDRWVPIPGSGLESECARCGRSHEIHAEVALEDGSTAVVGVSCARGDSIEPEVRRGASRAKTLARLRAEVAGAATELERLRAAHAEVESLPRPAVRWDEAPVRVGRTAGTLRRCAIVGDARALKYNDWQADSELVDLACEKWRLARLADRNAQTPLYFQQSKVDSLRLRIERLES